ATRRARLAAGPARRLVEPRARLRRERLGPDPPGGRRRLPDHGVVRTDRPRGLAAARDVRPSPYRTRAGLGDAVGGARRGPSTDGARRHARPRVRGAGLGAAGRRRRATGRRGPGRGPGVIEIRLPRLTDTAPLADLAATVIGAARVGAFIKSHLERHHLMVAEAAGEVVGLLAYRTDWFECTFVSLVVVRDDFRRRGIAREF